MPFSHTEYFRTVPFKVLRFSSYAWKTMTSFPLIRACIGSVDGKTDCCRERVTFFVLPFVLLVLRSVPPFHALVSFANAVSISFMESFDIWSVLPCFWFLFGPQSGIVHFAREHTKRCGCCWKIHKRRKNYHSYLPNSDGRVGCRASWRCSEPEICHPGWWEVQILPG